MTIIPQTCGNRVKPPSHSKIRHREALICISSLTKITKEGGTWRTEASPRCSQIIESPKHPLFLELCCVIGDNCISMNLHRREINGSSPSWRIKKKKILWSQRFTNPPTLSAYISRKPKRPGHRQTYAKWLRGSRGPGSRRLPQPAPSPELGAARPPEDPHPSPAPPVPASSRERTKQTLGLPGDPGAGARKGKRPPTHGPVRAPSPSLIRTSTQRSPGEGASPGLGLPARPAAASSAPAAPHTCRRGPARVRPRAAAPPGPGAPVPSGPHRNALEDAPGRGCPDVFGVAVADNGGLLAAAIAHQVIHVALPTGHLRALRTAAGTARSSRRSGGGRGRRRRRGGGEEAALRKHRPPPSPRSCGGRTRGRR